MKWDKKERIAVASPEVKTKLANDIKMGKINEMFEKLKIPDPEGIMMTAVLKTLDSELLKAAEKGDLGRMKELLDEGADINVEIDFKNTLLLEVVIHSGGRDLSQKPDNLDIVSVLFPMATLEVSKLLTMAKFLIDNGADVNAANENGKTSLQYASDYGHTELCGLLLAHGANASAKSDGGFIPLDFANNDEIRKLLSEAMEKSNKE